MAEATVNVNLHIDDYTNRVLGVIKEKYGLKDKSQALMYFAKMHGKDLVDLDSLEVKDEFIRETLKMSADHIKKYGFKKSSIAELRAKIERD